MRVEEWDIGRVTPYENNPRDNDSAVSAVRASIEEFGWQQPIVVDKDGVIIAGHTRYKAALEMGAETVPVAVADMLTEEQVRAYRLADNKTHDLSGWLDAVLQDELDAIEDIDMSAFGFDLAEDVDFSNLEAMMGEKDEEYQAFEDKFKPKHTTDDCFTPPAVYEAVKEWVLREYGHTGEIVRPFYPGGDYQSFRYPKGCLVLDNPPFSIQAEITRFYADRGIDFFLFANGLTALNNLRAGVNVVLAHAQIIYENGANINTSFLTNLGRKGIRVAASLHDAIEDAQPKTYVSEQTLYDWPDNVVTAAMLGRLAMYGSEFEIENFEIVSRLDDGTAIFGKGALVSDAKAEKAKAEKARVKVTLSERERESHHREAQRDGGRTPMEAIHIAIGAMLGSFLGSVLADVAADLIAARIERRGKT